MKKRFLFILPLLFFTTLSAKEKGWCGTVPALKLFKEGKRQARPTLSGPVEFIERTNFRVHYTRSGVDACSPDYARSVADYFEYSWRKQIDTLGWAPPPPDYGIGGDDRYDVYIIELGSRGAAGIAVPENYYPNPYPDGVTSWIGIDNHLGQSFLKIVCAHEFNHASQMRYAWGEEYFIYENTAVWAEEVSYDEINHYISYLSTSPNPLTNPNYPINSTENLYLYAGGIWFIFLEEYYDRDCPRKIWERMGQIAGANTLNGIDWVLKNHYSSNLRAALKNYGLWRYFTNYLADTIHYFSEGHLWPPAYCLRTHSEYPCSGNQDPYPPLAPGGTSFIRLANGGGKLSIAFDGEDGYKWRTLVVGWRPNNSSLFALPLDSVTAQGRDSFNWLDHQHFVLIPVACDWESPSGGLLFNYNANCRIAKDVGVISLSGIPNTGDTSSVLTPRAWIKNYGVTPEQFPATFRIGAFYSNTQTINLNPGDSLLTEFLPCTLFTRGYQNYICTLALPGDERIANNSKTGRVLILVKDVGVLSILEPRGTIEQGRLVRPKVRIKNFGNLPAQFDVRFWIGTWTTTKRIYLAADREYDLTFDSTWRAGDTGEFTTRCSTAYADDKNPSNDKVVDSFFVRPSGIGEAKAGKERALGKRRTEIYNALGVKVGAGEGSNLPLVTNALPSGIYFLNIQTDDKKTERKILILR